MAQSVANSNFDTAFMFLNGVTFAGNAVQQTLKQSIPLVDTLTQFQQVATHVHIISQFATNPSRGVSFVDVLRVMPTIAAVSKVAIKNANILVANGPTLSSQFGAGISSVASVVAAHPAVFVAAGVTLGVGYYVYQSHPTIRDWTSDFFKPGDYTVQKVQQESTEESTAHESQSAQTIQVQITEEQAAILRVNLDTNSLGPTFTGYTYPEQPQSEQRGTIVIRNVTTPMDEARIKQLQELTHLTKSDIKQGFENVAPHVPLAMADRVDNPFQNTTQQPPQGEMQKAIESNKIKMSTENLDMIITEIDEDGNDIVPEGDDANPDANESVPNESQSPPTEGQSLEKPQAAENVAQASELVSVYEPKKAEDEFKKFLTKEDVDYLKVVGSSSFIGALLGYIWKKATQDKRTDINKKLELQFEDDQVTKVKVLRFLLTMVSKEDASQGKIEKDVTTIERKKVSDAKKGETITKGQRATLLLPTTKKIFRMWMLGAVMATQIK